MSVRGFVVLPQAVRMGWLDGVLRKGTGVGCMGFIFFAEPLNAREIRPEVTLLQKPRYVLHSPKHKIPSKRPKVLASNRQVCGLGDSMAMAGGIVSLVCFLQ
jgi:hypothetical protein